VIYSILLPGTFAKVSTFQAILGTQAVLLVVVLALVISLNAGEFDLSVGAALGFGSTMTAFLNGQKGWPIAIAIITVLCAGVLLGLFNALLIVRIGIVSPIATLASGTAIFGMTIGIASTQIQGGVSEVFVQGVATRFLGLPAAFYIALSLYFVAYYVLQHTPVGRYLLFVGRNREVARLSGVRVVAVSSGALVASTTLSVLAGILLAGVTGAADPNVGNTFLLPAFAGAFLGATAVVPGQFNVWGSFAAVYFLITGITGLQLLGFTGWVGQVFYGGALILALTFARLAAMRASRQGAGQTVKP
jgi:ribose transport system permease protein